ncbi:hypothetical protein [Hymenobacter terricola]|uniref:hypothetical protein n=1 Tax=Hymenobacter terricola TaxID=2819236 RepID=UPI001B30AC93|nr:hypothetical protein [Hymenobacter terricola]
MTPSRNGTSYSLVVLIVLFLLMVQARLWAPYWDTHNVLAILTWDAMGYYLYLPAKFIYNDLSYLRFVPDIMREYSPTGGFYQAFPAPHGPDGAMVMKYTCGLAILWTPFFLLGHWAAGWFGYAQDGFSAPYQIAIAFGGIAYGFLGLSMVRRVLLRYCSDVVVACTLALLVLGTNFLQYAVYDSAMAHVYAFTLYALLLWCTMHWHERPRLWLAAGIGLLLGLGILVRPSEAVAILLPLLWGISSKAAWQRKLALAKTYWRQLVVAGLFIGVGIAPQLLYWKWASGDFIVYSYQEQGFSFLHPHTWQFLFSVRKGWLFYTPLMVLPIIGLVVLWRRNRPVAVPVLAYFLINLWVVSAWDIWTYGGSFSQRSVVQSYAVLSIPLAYVLTWLGEQRHRAVLFTTLVPLIALLVSVNLFQTWQYMRSIITPDDMNRRYYWSIFNKTMPSQEDYTLLDGKTRLPGLVSRYDRRTLAYENFEQQASTPQLEITDALGFNSRHSCKVNTEHKYSSTLTVRLGAASLLPKQWVRASCQVYSEYGAWGNRLIVLVERNGQTVQWNNVRLQNNLSVSNGWTPIWVDVPLPDDALPDDVLKIAVENGGGMPCAIDDLKAEALVPKAR